MMTLFVIEPNKVGAEHLSFNAAILRVLLACARRGGVRVVFMSDRRHFELVSSMLAPEERDFSFEEIRVVSGLERKFARKFIREASAILRVMVRASRTRDTVVVLSLLANALPLTMFLARVFGRARSHVFLHGELESLLIPEKRKIYREGFWTKLALFRMWNGARPHLYVLGEGIRRRLLACYPSASRLQAIRVIEHPFSLRRSMAPRRERKSRLRVGFVGAGREIKGIAEFFRMAERLSQYVEDGRLELVVVGGIDRACQAVRNRWVEVLAEEAAGLAEDRFRRGIAELDSALFIYRRNYRLTASGAVFDVMNEGVEILSLPNDYLRDLACRDVEGGMKFFASMAELESELRKRVEAAFRPPRFTYDEIRRAHSSAVEDAVERTVLLSD